MMVGHARVSTGSRTLDAPGTRIVSRHDGETKTVLQIEDHPNLPARRFLMFRSVQPAPGRLAEAAFACLRLGASRAILLQHRHRQKVVDRDQHGQEDDPEAEAEGDQLLLDGEQRLIGRAFKLAPDVRLRHSLVLFLRKLHNKVAPISRPAAA
jgi:hypothetical protein